jgi:hypothetical protein
VASHQIVDGIGLRFVLDQLDDFMIHVNGGSLMNESQKAHNQEVDQSNRAQQDCSSCSIRYELSDPWTTEQTEQRQKRHQEPKLLVLGIGMRHNVAAADNPKISFVECPTTAKQVENQKWKEYTCYRRNPRGNVPVKWVCPIQAPVPCVRVGADDIG